MTIPSRSLLAAALGLCLVHPVPAGEPGPLGMTPIEAHPGRLALQANQQLANIIADHLRQSGQLRNYRVDVQFTDGLAELTGTVTDQMQREEVLRVVQGVPAVERVRDRLRLTDRGPVALAQADDPANNFQAPAPQPLNGNGGAGAYVEPMPVYQVPGGGHDLSPPKMPPYAWPTYAAYNNYSRVAEPLLYPLQAFPFIGPPNPFPKVPLGWRSVKLQWEDGFWWYSRTASGHDWWRVRYW